MSSSLKTNEPVGASKICDLGRVDRTAGVFASSSREIVLYVFAAPSWSWPSTSSLARKRLTKKKSRRNSKGFRKLEEESSIRIGANAYEMIK